MCIESGKKFTTSDVLGTKKLTQSCLLLRQCEKHKWTNVSGVSPKRRKSTSEYITSKILHLKFELILVKNSCRRGTYGCTYAGTLVALYDYFELVKNIYSNNNFDEKLWGVHLLYGTHQTQTFMGKTQNCVLLTLWRNFQIW